MGWVTDYQTGGQKKTLNLIICKHCQQQYRKGNGIKNVQPIGSWVSPKVKEIRDSHDNYWVNTVH